MSNTCDTDYYNVFMRQLVQTLAQLSASLIGAAVAVPFYSYYVKGSRNQMNVKSNSDSSSSNDDTYTLEDYEYNDNEYNDNEHNEHYNDNENYNNENYNGNHHHYFDDINKVD
jgi:hypothetical protein